MADLAHGRLGRELFLVTFGVSVNELEPWVIDRMTTLLADRWVGAGTTLYEEGDAPDDLYFMIDGAVRLSRRGSTPWLLRGRWVVGVLEGVAGNARPRTATALSDFQAMQVPIRGWVELLEDSFPLARGAVLNSARAVAELEVKVPHIERAPRPARPEPGDAPLQLIDRLALLAEVRMLSGSGVQSLVDLAATSRERRFTAGETILERGVERAEMLLVVSGEVVTDRQDPHVERRYGPGDIVCGVASFGAPAPLWEARALTPTRVIAFPIEAWFDLMEEHFDLVRSALGAVGTRREVLLERMARDHDELVLT
jgi:CRP-like cAMP-binding protein